MGNLKLQGILFLLWREYREEFDGELFKDPFITRPSGPHILDNPDVFSIYPALPIRRTYKVDLEWPKRAFIDEHLPWWIDEKVSMINVSVKNTPEWEYMWKVKGNNAVVYPRQIPNY